MGYEGFELHLFRAAWGRGTTRNSSPTNEFRKRKIEFWRERKKGCTHIYRATNADTNTTADAKASKYLTHFESKRILYSHSLLIPNLIVYTLHFSSSSSTTSPLIPLSLKPNQSPPFPAQEAKVQAPILHQNPKLQSHSATNLSLSLTVKTVELGLSLCDSL